MGLLAKVIANVQTASPANCYVWPGETDRHGYGRAWIGGRKRAMAHRAVYQVLVGEIPNGLELDHLCRNRGCVNPVHLEPVTPAVNVRRARGIPGDGEHPDACVNGHAYDESNTYIAATGTYYCRACNRAAAARNYERKNPKQ